MAQRSRPAPISARPDPGPAAWRSLAAGAVAALLLSAAGATAPAAQEINPALLASRWQAQWIRPLAEPHRGVGVFLFRRTFDLAARPPTFVVHASGDQRYELFVNGVRVATGPARGDLDHWRFETVDLAPALREGRNVVAAVVWSFGTLAPMAQVSHETAFVLQGDGEAESIVNTGKGWKTTGSGAWTPLPVDRQAIFYQYFVSGPGEQIDASKHPWGWERPDFDDSGWADARAVTVAAPRGVRDSPSRWFLVPRRIPPMETRPERLASVVRTDGARPPDGWLAGAAPWTIPARSRVTLLLDAGRLTTAYPEVVTSEGEGASVSLTYAEALYEKREDGRRGAKGNRNEVDGKILVGLRDRFLPDGGAARTFRPLWWRTYRYVEMTVETAGEPLTIADVRASFSAYPYVLRGRFSSSDPVLDRIFGVGWRTVRLCSHETFMDTPYWEQLQYVGDTRIQAIVSLLLSGDDRLVKAAIRHFDESRTPEGLTQSRYPTELPQFIPPFSLFWVGMLHDLWWYGGDREFLAPYLAGARGVLEWFEARLAPTDLPGPLEWWNYVDWVDSFENGQPPFLDGGQSAIISLQFVLALREGADLEEAFGSRESARRYRALADRVAGGVRRACWDAARGLFADTPAKETYSQHVNVLAVLAGLLPAQESRALMTKVLDDESLTPATYYFRFYLFRALRAAGLEDRYLDLLGPWRGMLDLGLTTWAERPEPTRSDSHAWSAHPSADLLTIVAGIQPAEPGYGRVRIEPHLGALERLDAAAVTPRGEVAVRYTRAGGRLEALVSLPAGVTGTFAWRGVTRPLAPGAQTFVLDE